MVGDHLGLSSAVGRPAGLAAHGDHPLVSADAGARLVACARRLPAGGQAALEARLGPSTDPAVDLSIGVTSRDHARQLIHAFDGPGAAAARRCLGAFARAADGFAAVPALWLELDLPADDGVDAPVPVPVVCARLPPDAGVPFVLDTLLPTLCGPTPVPEAQRRRLTVCLDTMPADARPLYLFDLAPRPGDALRLETYAEDPRPLVSWLRGIAPPAHAGRLAGLVRLAGDADRWHLSFDLLPDGSLGPRLGLEVSQRRWPHREPRWGALVDRLVAAGLCTADQRQAIFAWPGWATPESAAGRWPAGETGVCVRALSHVKLTAEPGPGSPTAAKVYLLVQHLRRADRRP